MEKIGRHHLAVPKVLKDDRPGFLQAGYILWESTQNERRGLATMTILGSLCELLGKAHCITKEETARALAGAAAGGMTPGQYLYNNQIAKPQLIRAAILCQLFMRQELLPLQLALEALKVIKRDNISLENALEILRWDRLYYENFCSLSDILIRSGLITAADRDLAHDVCFERRLPFVATLVQRRALTDVMADYVLTVHAMMREGSINFDRAVELLTVQKPLGGRTTQEMEIPVTKGVRIGELLVAAQLITSVQLISGVERARLLDKRIGEVLVEEGTLPVGALNMALETQKRIDHGQDVAEAVQELVTRTSLFRRVS